MQSANFSAILTAFHALQGREVNISGGDPLLNPQIKELLNDPLLAEFEKVAISTNALLLERILERDCLQHLDEAKISLHTISNNSKQLLGAAYDARKTTKNIERLRNYSVPVTLNFTVTSENIDELPKILEFATRTGCNVLVIDLIASAWSSNATLRPSLGYTTLEQDIARLTEAEPTEITDRTGCVMKQYLTRSGTSVTIKNISYGRLYTKMCQRCSSKQECGEGVFMLRIDCFGVVKPCLTRRDLDLLVPDVFCSESIRTTLEKGIITMFPTEDTCYE